MLLAVVATVICQVQLEPSIHFTFEHLLAKTVMLASQLHVQLCAANA